jgi:hypothetical protein
MYQQAILNNSCVVFIVSPRGQVCVHNTSLTTSRVIEAPVPNQESARSYVCVRDIDFSSFHDFFSSDFGTISKVWYFLFLISLVVDVIDVWFVLYVVPVVFILFVFIYEY